MQWIPETQIIYTTKITVATVSVIITTSGNSTWPPTTRTVFGYVPPEYALYSLAADEQGTAVVSVPIPQSDGLTSWLPLTYPTPYFDYSTEYRWQGVLRTHDKASSPACATVTPKPANVPLLLHPEYPQPKGEFRPGKIDLFGNEHKPLWAPVKDEPDKLFFDAAFPMESAFSFCESIPAASPLPTQYEAPKFVTDYTTVYTSPETVGVIIIQPSASGWEITSTSEKCCSKSMQIPHLESSQPGFDTKKQTPTSKPPPGIVTTSAAIHIEISASGFGTRPSINPPQAQHTEEPEAPSKSKPPNVVTLYPSLPPAVAVAVPTPVFTSISTDIDGQPTTIPAYILPGSGETATIGQSVTINGQPTILAMPPTWFTMVPTAMNGIAMSVPVYIISGTGTATLGQTVTIDGKPTVLAVPDPTLKILPTTINGVVTFVPAYIIGGTSTVAPGQTVILNGQSTVLPAPSAVLTWVSTTIDGVPTSVPVYIIGGSSTATVGQTVIIDGSTTVLSMPTSTEEPNPGLGGPDATTFRPKAAGTGSPSQGAGVRSVGKPWNAMLLILGVAMSLWL